MADKLLVHWHTVGVEQTLFRLQTRTLIYLFRTGMRTERSEYGYWNGVLSTSTAMVLDTGYVVQWLLILDACHLNPSC